MANAKSKHLWLFLSLGPVNRLLPYANPVCGCVRADACVVPSKLLTVSANSGDGRPNPVYNYPSRGH